MTKADSKVDTVSGFLAPLDELIKMEHTHTNTKLVFIFQPKLTTADLFNGSWQVQAGFSFPSAKLVIY